MSDKRQAPTGFLVEDRDPVALADAILRYLSPPDLLADHGTAGLERAVAAFSLEAMTPKYLALYDLALRRKS